MLAGGTAGVAMWSVAIPPDVSLASHLKIWRGQGRSSEADELARTCLGRQTDDEMARNRDCEVAVRERDRYLGKCATNANDQTIKSRLQSAPQGTYSGFLDCARKLIAADGVTALWKGFGPAMARAFPANVSSHTFHLL